MARNRGRDASGTAENLVSWRIARSDHFWSIASIALLFGCKPPVQLALELAPDTLSVVIAQIDGNDVQVQTRAAPELMASRLDIARSDELAIVILEYQRPLDALAMRAGSLPAAPASGTLLPPASRISISRVGVGDNAWASLDEPPKVLASFRFTPIPIEECLLDGGCLVADGAAAPACQIPCPTPPTVLPPEAPAEPMMTPCPTGWTPIPGALATTCAPYGEAVAPGPCPAGQMHRPGRSGCEPLGRTCPTGDFADDVPPSALYVLAGATANPDGTIGAPFPTIAEAIQRAPDGSFIAVGKGRYEATTMAISKPLTIAGACSEATIVATPINEVFVIASSGVVLSELDLEGAAGIRVQPAGNATLEAIGIEARTGVGVLVDRGVLNAHAVAVPSSDIAIQVANRGQATFDDVVLTDATRVGVSTQGLGTFLELRDFAISDTVVGADIAASSSVSMTRGSLSRYTSTALLISRSTTTLEDVVIRDAGNAADFGVVAFNEAHFEADRLWIADSRTVAISATNATATLRDLVVEGTQAQAFTLEHGNAIGAFESGSVRVRRGILSGSHTGGVLVGVGPSQMVLEDVTIVDTLGRVSDGEGGTGMLAVDGGELQVARVRVAGSHGFGAVADLRGRLTGSDLRIVDTVPRNSNGAYGRAIEVSGGGFVDLERLAAARNKSSAIFVLDDGSTFNARDMRLEQTAKSGCFEFSCQTATADGLVVQLGAKIDVEKFEIIDNNAFGLRISTNDVRFRHGRIAGNEVGVQVTAIDFDFAKIGEGVVIENNIANITTFDE